LDPPLRPRRRDRDRRLRTAGRVRAHRHLGLRAAAALAARARSHVVRSMSRAAVVVLDACGGGAPADAAVFGDAGAAPLGHLAQPAGRLDLPTLGALGLGSILELAGVPAVPDPVLHGRLAPLGPGKDSTTGHWELMGVTLVRRPPTYPGGFPDEVVDAL